MIREGSWGFTSKLDPRWDANGRGRVGGFCTYDDVPEAKIIYENNKKELGDPPKDLEFWYFKD